MASSYLFEALVRLFPKSRLKEMLHCCVDKFLDYIYDVDE